MHVGLGYFLTKVEHPWGEGLKAMERVREFVHGR